MTEWFLFLQIEAEEADEGKAREAAVEAAEAEDLRVDDEDGDEHEEPDDLSPDDLQRMIAEQRAVIDAILKGGKGPR